MELSNMKKTPPSPLTKLALADPYNSELAKSQKLPTSPSDDKETISKRSLKMESNSPSPNAVDAMLVNNENKGSKDCNKRSADCTPLDASTKQKKIRTTKIKDSPRLEAHAKAAIHYCDINSRIRMLFAKGVISKTCMSARIFACYTLYIEQQQGSTSSTKMQETPSRITRRSHSTQLPILSFLQALVCIESISLGDKPVQRKLVQFSAYDGSSTKPPRDSVMGSHISRQASVDAMVDAVNEINKLLSLTQNDNRNTVIESLQSLSNFLALLETKTKENDSEHKKLRQECAKSMPIEWDQNRFAKAARLYRQDINKICNCLQQQKQEAAKTVRKSLNEFDVKLNLQIKLAESMGRTIRYHLRRLFNPIYGPITLDETFEEQSKGKNDNDAFRHPSKMSEILQMRHPDWYSAGSNSAVADGSVSAVLNVALETIVNYFGAELFLTGSKFVMPTIPTSFCNSPAAKRGIKEITENVSDEALVTILNETVDAQRFLAAAKACRFIIDLLNWPGVEEEISRLGGWTLIERCATQFHLHCLDKLSPNDAHLSVLKNVPLLLERIRQCWNNMQNAAKDCTDELDNMWIRFQCDQYSTVSSNKKSRRNKKRSGVTIKEVLVEGLQHHMFPNIVEPEIYEDESEGDEE